MTAKLFLICFAVWGIGESSIIGTYESKVKKHTVTTTDKQLEIKQDSTFHYEFSSHLLGGGISDSGRWSVSLDTLILKKTQPEEIFRKYLIKKGKLYELSKKDARKSGVCLTKQKAEK